MNAKIMRVMMMQIRCTPYGVLLQNPRTTHTHTRAHTYAHTHTNAQTHTSVRARPWDCGCKTFSRPIRTAQPITALPG